MWAVIIILIVGMLAGILTFPEIDSEVDTSACQKIITDIDQTI